MGMDSQVQILRSAIDNEIRSFQYYLDAAGKTESPRVRQVWLDLSRDEIEHMRFLQAQVAALSQAGKWIEEKADQPRHQAGLAFAAYAGQKPIKSDLEALRGGLKFEEQAHGFYEDAANKSTDAVGKRTYLELAAMESEHYRLIQDTIMMYEDPSQWQYLQLPPMLEG
jgi:rubrerythrin